MAEEVAIELSRLYREALKRLDERMRAQQLGEIFKEIEAENSKPDK